MSNFNILDFENFATASHRCIGAISKLVDGKLVDYIYDGRARHGQLVDCNLLTPFFLDLSYGLFLQLCSSKQDFD